MSGGLSTFNIQDGFLEGIVRGMRSSLLTTVDYNNLCQCESLEDFRLHLQSTDYGGILQHEPSPLVTSTISARCSEKMVADFHQLRGNAVEPLSEFLDYITYGYMIDNIVLVLSGTLHGRASSELIEKCHPLGMFDSLPALCIAQTAADVYNTVLVDTPVGKYFNECLDLQDLDELNIEFIRNLLYKAYIEDFYNFCEDLGGMTAEVMRELLYFEADRRAINITLNSFGTELSKDDRVKLCPSIGELYPVGTEKLGRCDDVDSVRLAVEFLPMYRSLFSQSSFNQEKTLEDSFMEKEVEMCKDSFDPQFHYGIFFSYFRLKEQEIRNIVWIAECVQQNQKGRINQYIPIF